MHLSFFLFLEISGVNTPNPFDHMRTAAMLGGPTANIRPTPPAAGLFITSGVGPYVGFFYAVEVMKNITLCLVVVPYSNPYKIHIR